MERLEGRTAVVTGAASGIGLAVAEAFTAEGMQVVLADRDEGPLREHAARLGGHPVVTDVTDPDAVDRLAAEAVDRFGGLHVAMSNAGIVNGGPCWELPLEEWRRVLDVNLWGVIHGVRSFVPRILATGEEGHVVNTGSLASVMAIPGIAPYVVAKHGVLGLSDVLRADLAAAGAPIGVSVVLPGMISTGLNPIGTLPPANVAANVVDAIKRGRDYVFTDDHEAAAIEARLDAIRRAKGEFVVP
jgi:NAD(P)-dependent dehydrogenase (short-subunit alcohol dehydrogenase family)